MISRYPPPITHYSLNLGNASIFQSSLDGFQITGGTILITFQLDGSGPTPYTDTLDIDNLELTMVPEPATFALAGLGAAALLVFRRKV